MGLTIICETEADVLVASLATLKDASLQLQRRCAGKDGDHCSGGDAMLSADSADWAA